MGREHFRMRWSSGSRVCRLSGTGQWLILWPWPWPSSALPPEADASGRRDALHRFASPTHNVVTGIVAYHVPGRVAPMYPDQRIAEIFTYVPDCCASTI